MRNVNSCAIQVQPSCLRVDEETRLCGNALMVIG
jgi:hypothetical protein